MKFRLTLFSLSLFSLFLFTAYSYTVAKEAWIQQDFDITVKFQDRIPERFDEYFSYFSILGSVEVTVGFCILMLAFSLIRLKLLPILGWLMIVPATLIEVFGKLVLFHPSPPIFLHRTNVFTHLPSFYVHTDFSYPSGHMTRTIFIVTILVCMTILEFKNSLTKITALLVLLTFAILMGVTRISLGEHWTSDVIGGTFLGAGMGFFASILVLSPKKV